MNLARRRQRIMVGRNLAPWVGVIERSDPIPPGVYWIDSIDPDAYEDEETVQMLRETYMQLLQNVFPGAYRIIRTVRHEPQLIGDTPGRDWILFEVTRPIPRWPPGTEPTVAPNGVDTQEGDTVQRPPPEKGVFEDETLGIPTWALFAGGVVVLGVVVYAASR
jgi:hypothetical protein